MLNNLNKSFDLNKFLSQLKTNKQYSNQLKKQSIFLTKIKEKDYKFLPLNLNKNNQLNISLAMYNLNIKFSRSNTLFSITDCSGNTKFFYSAGLFNFKGRQKISRALVLKSFYKILILKLKFLRNKPLCITFKNVGFNSFWFLKKLRQKFFIVSVKSFSSYPYNGCRRKKIRRKKRRNG